MQVTLRAACAEVTCASSEGGACDDGDDDVAALLLREGFPGRDQGASAERNAARAFQRIMSSSWSGTACSESDRCLRALGSAGPAASIGRMTRRSRRQPPQPAASASS